MTSFIGRHQEIAAAKGLLSASRVLTLTGTGGVGKTRLALQIAASLRRAFHDGVWLVELAHLTDAGMLPRTVAGTVGLRDESPSPTARLAEHLSDKQLLLVLDNCEHLPDACAYLLDTILPVAPSVKVLNTSRQRLGVDGEQLMNVDPLPVTPEGGSRQEAVQLFVERARATAPGFELTDANRDTVVAICRKLDGLPLAIELAAVWVAALTPEQILAQLSDRFRLLSGGRRGSRPNQRTLQAAVDWSFSLCSPQERALWTRLSVFTGGFDLDAVEAVCVDDEVPREDVVSLVAALLDKSVIDRLTHLQDDRTRFRMLETIQSYGLAKLAESGREHEVRQRHRDHYRRLSMRYEAECFGAQQVDWLLRLRADHANLRSAIEFCLNADEGCTALEVAGPTYHWISSGYLREGLTWLDRALAADQEPSAVRAKALWVRSFLAILLGEEGAPERMLAECRALAEQLDRTNIFYPKIWQCQGLAAFMHGDVDESERLFEKALEWHLRAGPGHFHCAFDCMFQLALISLHRDDEQAEERVRRCLAFCEQHGADWSRSYALWLQGVLLWRRGDTDDALPLLYESIRLRQPVDDQTGLALCVEVIAWCEAANHRWERAATLLGAAMSVVRHSGANIAHDPMHRFAHDEVETHVRAQLGPELFARHYNAGAACSPEEAVALALPEQRRRETAAAAATSDVLTRREAEIADLIAAGRTNREIAAALVISQRTAESHVDHILSKLGFTSRTQIATWVMERRTALGGR
ncbi:ATP-binding protein [Saccharothrix deserti]|uniref:ATP-binding protein n=1 Tax=Saccharothrix deserti TaxID=2593674 RepID=UPI00131BBABD|nr:LuxR C-terminal-related transcriptional regulator [Saccharothrix deserti]